MNNIGCQTSFRSKHRYVFILKSIFVLINFRRFFRHVKNLLKIFIYPLADYSSWTPFSIACQASVAHLIRAGNLETPCNASISAKSSSPRSTSSPIIIWEKNADMFNASDSFFPLIACVIIDADAMLMEHPSPSNFTSFTMSSSRSEEHTSELQSRGHLVCRLLLEK